MDNVEKTTFFLRARKYYIRAAVACIFAVLAAVPFLAFGAPKSEAPEPELVTLKAELQSKDREVKRQALRKLRGSKAEGAYEALEAALQDEDPEIRGGAASGLGATRDPRAVGRLAKLIESEDVSTRLGAISGLGFTGSRDALEPLVGLLASGDLMIRWNAVASLGRLKDAGAVKPLAEALKSDKSSRVRRAVVGALFSIGGKAAAKALKEGEDDEDRKVRKAAAKARQRLEEAGG